jgi:hypothetical protein
MRRLRGTGIPKGKVAREDCTGSGSRSSYALAVATATNQHSVFTSAICSGVAQFTI